MARIPTYAIDTVFEDNDLLLGTDGSTTALVTKNFRVGGLKDHIIDCLIEPNATDFHIPVFHTGGTRITDSIISQNTYPNGTTITIAGGVIGTSTATFYGNLSAGGTLDVGGEGTVTKKLHIKGKDGVSGILKLNCENNTHGVQIQGPAHLVGADYTLVLPDYLGTVNQQLTIASITGGSPAAVDGTAKLIWSESVVLSCPGSIYLGENAGASDPCDASADPSAGAIGPNYNVGIGQRALESQINGQNPVSGAEIAGENVGVGFQALQLTTTGTNNIAIGSNSLKSNTTGYNNVAISKNALGSIVNASQNIVNNITSIGIGFSAGNPSVNQPNQVGHIGDIFIGHQSGADQVYSNSTKNIFLGFRAGRNSGNSGSVLTSFENVVIGAQAGLNVSGPDGSPLPFNRNIFIGKNAGHSTFGSDIQDNIILGSRGTDPLYLKAGNVVFHTGGFGNNIGIPNSTNVDGGVSNNFVLGSNISVYGSQNIILNPNRSTDSSTGISVGESDFRTPSGIWDDDFSRNVIIGGGETPGIKISATGVGNTTTQNVQNTIINSASSVPAGSSTYLGIQLESNSIYDVANNNILGSNDIHLKTNMGTGTNGNQIRGNTFINSQLIAIEGRFEGNTIINYKGSSETPNVNFNKQVGSAISSAGTSNNFIIGRFGSNNAAYQVYTGASNNIIGPMGSGIEVMGDGNLMFGTSNIKLFNDSHSNLAFGQAIYVGTDTPAGVTGNKRAQRCLFFGFNHQNIAKNQSLVNSLVGGSTCHFDNGTSTQVSNSIVLGNNLIGKSNNAAYFGKHNENSTGEDLLVVGCGGGGTNRANGLEVKLNANPAAQSIGKATVVMPETVTADFADDTAAAAAGIPIGGIYHTSGTLKIRIS